MSAAQLRAAIEAAYRAAPVDPALAFQTAVRQRLVETPSLVAIVPATAIVDGQRHPNTFPAITFGAPQTFASDLTFARQHATIALDLHLWLEDTSTVAAQKLANVVRATLFSRPLTSPEITFADVRYQGSRILRDPSDKYVHAVVSLEALARWRP